MSEFRDAIARETADVVGLVEWGELAADAILAMPEMLRIRGYIREDCAGLTPQQARTFLGLGGLDQPEIAWILEDDDDQ